MAIKNELLVFNNIETTDAYHALTELPFRRTPAYLPGITFTTDFVEKNISHNGRGSKLYIRKLNKATPKAVKATAANALDFEHKQTADDIEEINIDDVISRSEKIYQAVEAARTSEEGALKAESALDDVLEDVQAGISGYLTESVPANTTDAAITNGETMLAALLDTLSKLDENPDVLVVPRIGHTRLLELLTTGHFRANSREDVVRTGVVGTILGMDVVIDDNLAEGTDFVMYNHRHFPVFTIFNVFDMVEAIDFKGTYARAQVVMGGGREALEAADIGAAKGVWGLKYQQA